MPPPSTAIGAVITPPSKIPTLGSVIQPLLLSTRPVIWSPTFLAPSPMRTGTAMPLGTIGSCMALRKRGFIRPKHCVEPRLTAGRPAMNISMFTKIPSPPGESTAISSTRSVPATLLCAAGTTAMPPARARHEGMLEGQRSASIASSRGPPSSTPATGTSARGSICGGNWAWRGRRRVRPPSPSDRGTPIPRELHLPSWFLVPPANCQPCWSFSSQAPTPVISPRPVLLSPSHIWGR
ncbi:hypothetical protein DFH06DRAFT_1470972 [Mycena polygramma]|nr:hypothetical protein DFH06DRAFT_1470972 [Mycena polygramma]